MPLSLRSFRAENGCPHTLFVVSKALEGPCVVTMTVHHHEGTSH